MSLPCPEQIYVETAVADLDDRHARRPEPFRWFSEKVASAAAIGGDEALTALSSLIDEAAAQKERGFGPPQHDINQARREWLEIYEQVYGRSVG